MSGLHSGGASDPSSPTSSAPGSSSEKGFFSTLSEGTNDPNGAKSGTNNIDVNVNNNNNNNNNNNIEPPVSGMAVPPGYVSGGGVFGDGNGPYWIRIPGKPGRFPRFISDGGASNVGLAGTPNPGILMTESCVVRIPMMFVMGGAMGGAFGVAITSFSNTGLAQYMPGAPLPPPKPFGEEFRVMGGAAF